MQNETYIFVSSLTRSFIYYLFQPFISLTALGGHVQYPFDRTLLFISVTVLYIEPTRSISDTHIRLINLNRVESVGLSAPIPISPSDIVAFGRNEKQMKSLN